MTQMMLVRTVLLKEVGHVAVLFTYRNPFTSPQDIPETMTLEILVGNVIEKLHEESPVPLSYDFIAVEGFGILCLHLHCKHPLKN